MKKKWLYHSHKIMFYEIVKKMKLTIFILCISVFGCFAVDSYSQSTKLSLHLENVTIKNALREIEEQSEFRFFFSNNVDVERKVSVRIQEKQILDILNELFREEKVRFNMIGRQIAIFNAEEELTSAFSGQQNKTITGKLTNINNEPLPGVTVRLKGTTDGTITDIEGNYVLKNVPADATLVFSFVGMKTQEVKVAGKTSVNVMLEEEILGIEEVVAIGYGTQLRGNVTTSISKLDTEVLENIPYANPASALQGTIAGVRVQSLSGQPGDAPRVIVRGGTSIDDPDSAEPLYLIDGVIKPNMYGINAEDIESVQILKDAASTAIYGARGSNGVVLVTTKSGKAGRNQITYNYDITFSDAAAKLPLLGARDFIYYQRMGIKASAERTPSQLALLSAASAGGTGNNLTNKTYYTTQYLTSENEYKLGEGWESMTDPIDPSKTIIFKETDFQDILFRTGISHNHYLSASGGTENATLSMGVGYLTEEGIAIGTDFERLSLNLNGDLKISDHLKTFGRLMYIYSSDNTMPAGEASMFGRSVSLPSTAKYKFEDGTLAPGDRETMVNPAYKIDYEVADNSRSDLMITFGAEWNLLPDLTFQPQVSLNVISNDGRTFRKKYIDRGNTIDSRKASGAYDKSFQKQADAVFSYNKVFHKMHHVEAKAGFSYFATKYNDLSATGQGAASDYIVTLNAAAEPLTVGGSESEFRLIGYFGRINYDFNKRYLVSINARYDGASNLGNSNKWGFFPGVSLGWNLHNEKFWNFLPENLIRLKLRGSYGVNGNIGNLGNYQAQGTYAVGSKYAGNAAVQNTVLENQELQWEESRTLNFGMDVGLFQNRIRMILDGYRRVTDNLLTDLALPLSTGFSSILTNYGSLENKGIELELSARVLPDHSPVQWNVTFNAARVKNKITELPENGVENNRVGGQYIWDSKTGDYAWKGGLQEGHTMGDMFAYKHLGIYSTDEEAASGTKDDLIPGTNKTKKGGDVIFLDADDNGVVNTYDRVYVGNPYPDWTGGFSSTFTYKNISLYARLDYAAGHIIENYTRIALLCQSAGFSGLRADLLRSWKAQGDVTDIPRFAYADQQFRNNYRITTGMTSYAYEKGDYLALREVTLAYQLPQKLLERIKLRSLRLNLTGRNLHYFTGYRGLNPEYGGRDNGRYPLPRNITLGVNVTF